MGKISNTRRVRTGGEWQRVPAPALDEPITSPLLPDHKRDLTTQEKQELLRLREERNKLQKQLKITREELYRRGIEIWLSNVPAWRVAQAMEITEVQLYKWHASHKKERS